MKKILAIVLALCLVLSLGVVASAKDSSPAVPPENPAGGMPGLPNYHFSSSTGASSVAAKETAYLTINGSLVNGATFSQVTSGPVFGEVAAYDATGVAYIDLPAGVTGPVEIEMYAPNTDPETAVVLVRDEWEVLDGANLEVYGNRVVFTADAETIKAWHYFAIVNNYTAVNVDVPAEQGDTEEDPAEGDDMTVDDGADAAPAEEPEKSPVTGIALAVVPMMVAAAAIVVSKKR